MAPESAAPAFVVTQQAETTDLGPAGVYVSGVRITFRTASGAIGSVFLPHDSYTVDNAAAAIRAKVIALDTVGALTS
jgi:hypothetical protein